MDGDVEFPTLEVHVERATRQRGRNETTGGQIFDRSLECPLGRPATRAERSDQLDRRFGLPARTSSRLAEPPAAVPVRHAFCFVTRPESFQEAVHEGFSCTSLILGAEHRGVPGPGYQTRAMPASHGTTNKIRRGDHQEVVCGEVGHEAARRVPHADVKGGDEIDPALLNVRGRSLASLGANRAVSSNAAETTAHRCSGLTLMPHPEPQS